MNWVLRTLLVISLAALPLYVYVGLRLAASISLLRPELKRPARRVTLLSIGWVYLLPLSVLVFHYFRSTDRLFLFADALTWADFVLYYPVWIALILVLELMGPFLLFDLLALLFRFLPSVRQAVRRGLAFGRIGLAVLMFVYVPVRAALDTAHVRDTEIEIPVPDLPPELEGIQITLVGDIQVDRYSGAAKVDQVRHIVERHAPALLLSSGDLVTSGTEFLQRAKQAICGLKGTTGTLAVMGDHDYWSAPEAVRDLHGECNWDFLQNGHRVFVHAGRTICVSGLTQIYSERMTPGELDEFLDTAPDADLKILLAHQPREGVATAAARHAYSLFLAGHTHGGQIVLHPFGIPLTPSMRETPFYTGVHTVGPTTVVVTNGVGLTLAPVRYHAPAEVTSMVLRRAR